MKTEMMYYPPDRINLTHKNLAGIIATWSIIFFCIGASLAIKFQHQLIQFAEWSAPYLTFTNICMSIWTIFVIFVGWAATYDLVRYIKMKQRSTEEE